MSLAVKQIKIDVGEVVVGMFVSGLDRPWTQTPFPIQGFYVHDIDATKQLKTHCNHVYIDVTKGTAPATVNLKTMNPREKTRRSDHKVKQPSSSSLLPLKVNSSSYPKQEPLEKEARRARQLHQRVFGAVGEVMVQVGSGNVTDVHETKRVAASMVDSILRNPDAFTWLSRIRDTDEHTYGHAVRSAVWAILFGRHIGLAKSELDTLALAVLLKDVGKTHIRRELLLDDERTTQEQAEFEGFIDAGVEILKKISGVEPRVIAVVKTHCERINGSGFPLHLKGDNIPLLGKIAGIVTFYDEVTNPRGVSDPIAPSKAVSHLYQVRGVEFQEDLVVEFIRAIGLYPTGTLVELTTGQVGIVLEQNFERRLKPKIMLLLNEFKQPIKKRRLLDLAADDISKQALIDSGKKRLDEVEKIEIAQDLEPGSYDIDINEIRDKYLLKSFKDDLFSFFKR
jgi:HD-GYP domain-containing protein (c-di-GMP phosphodiesterase class II)